MILTVCKAQITFNPVINAGYFNTYKPGLIKSNKVYSITSFYCENCLENKKNDTVKYYKKFFDSHANEIKIINYNLRGKVTSVDSFVYNVDNKDCDIYTLKNKSQHIYRKIIDFSEMNNIIYNPEKLKTIRKQKIRKINFVDVNVLKYYRFMFNGKNLQLNFGEENDENENIEKVLIWNEIDKIADSISYIYDDTHFSGRSIVIKNQVKYLHSTVMLNKNLQVVQENIFDVEYNKLDMKLASVLEPSSSIIYHYYANGLISYIEFLQTENSRDVHFYTYEYYNK